LHLEVIQHRLTRDFGMKVKFYKPRVNYRETVEKLAEVVGQCNRQIGDKQLFARLRLRLEPAKDPSALVRVRDLLPAEDPLPPTLRTAALEELNARAHGGGAIAGFPLSGVVISLLGAEFHDQGSDEVAFRIAAADGIERGLQEARPLLLEPLMRVEVNTPADFLGEIVGDLQQRRGEISATDHRGFGAVVVANTPLSELFGYSNAIRSLSQGRASASMEPAGYQSAPAQIAESFVAG
jgi:elongation factor G